MARNGWRHAEEQRRAAAAPDKIEPPTPEAGDPGPELLQEMLEGQTSSTAASATKKSSRGSGGKPRYRVGPTVTPSAE
jgi:hypothetical protein